MARGAVQQARVAARRPRLASPSTATALAVLIVLLAAAAIPLDAVAHQNVLANAGQLLTSVPIGVVGFILARRRPDNPIGWLLLALLAGIMISSVADPYTCLVLAVPTWRSP